MATTAIGICSAALLKLGATPITSFADGPPEAAVAETLYPIVRDGLISAHPWTFTITQTSLATPATPLSIDFTSAFALPADCLRVVSAGAGNRGRGLDYRIQGSQILADADV